MLGEEEDFELEFTELMYNVRRKKEKTWDPPKKILALDPGETTGWATFVDGELQKSGEVGQNDSLMDVMRLIDREQPTTIVVEAYRIYSWKADTHSWSDLFTPRLIGAIELKCIQNKIPMYTEMAQGAKNFCTNKKLKSWGYYKKGARHARDAIRHGCYWLVFGKKEKDITRGR